MVFDRKAYMKKYNKEYSQRPKVKIKNREYMKKYHKEWYQKNKEELKAKAKEYKQI